MTTPTNSNLAALAKLAGNKPVTNDVLKQAQEQQVQNGAAINTQIAAAEVTRPVSANAPPQVLTREQRETPTRAFQGPFWGYTSFLTPKGKVFAFYNGCIVTQDPEVIAECANIAGVVEIDPQSPDIQYPPSRGKGQGRSATANHPAGEGFSQTTITPLELMTRSIGNSTHVPQASESFSQTSN